MARPAPTSFAVAALLTAVVAFGPASTDLYLPSLPAMVRHFRTDVSQVQLTLSVFVAGFAVCQLLYGPLSDRFGRRPVLLAGIVTYIVASTLCVFAPTIEWLMAGRFLQALGACSGPVLGRAVVRDVYPREQAARFLSYQASAMALMPAVAPIIGGWVSVWFGWHANFVLMALFGLALLPAVALMLAETNQHRDPHALRPYRIFRNYGRVLGDRRFLGPSLTMAFSFCGLFSFLSASSFVLIDVLGVEATRFGFAFACVVIGYITGTFISGRLGRRLGAERLVRAGVWLGVASAAVLAALAWGGIETVVAVVAPMSVYFMACGLVLPNSTAAGIAPFPTMAGSASAMIGFVQMSTGAVAGWAVGKLHDGTTVPMASVVLAMAVLALAARWVSPAKASALP